MSSATPQAKRETLRAQLKKIAAHELERLPDTSAKKEPDTRTKFLLGVLRSDLD